MAVNISTGRWVEADHMVGQIASDFKSVPMERVIYPSKDQELFELPPGYMAVLTAYDVHTGEFGVHKILRSSGIPEHRVSGTACCYTTAKADGVTLNRAELAGVRLSSSSPVVIIKIPGVYEVIKQRESANAVVTLMMYPIQEANYYSCGQVKNV